MRLNARCPKRHIITRSYTRIQHKHVVLLSGFLQNVFAMGYFYGLTRLLPALVEEYGWTRAEAGLLQSVNNTVFSCIGMVTGSLIGRFGPKTISAIGALLVAVSVSASFFTKSLVFVLVNNGLLAGIGMSFSYISAPAVIGRLYQGKSKPLALTVVSSGSSVGAIVYAYFMDYLLDRYGLRGTFLLCGGMAFHSFAMIMIWPEKTTEPNLNKTMGNININEQQPSNQVLIEKVENDESFKSAIKTYANVFRNKAFMMFTVGIAIYFISEVNVLVYMSDVVYDKSGNSSDASLVLLLFSITNTLGRFLPGILKQIPNVSVTAIPLVFAMIALAAKVLITFTRPVAYSMVGIAVSGLCFGGQMASFSVTTAKLIGDRNIAVGMGIIFTLDGLTSGVSGPLFGYIRDVTGSYIVPLQCSVGVLAVSVMFNCTSFCIRRRHTRPEHNNDKASSVMLQHNNVLETPNLN